MKRKLDIIIPIGTDMDWPSKDYLISQILEQHEKYGFTRFALTTPGSGWRRIGYPPKEHFLTQAQLCKEIQEAVASYGIECGWWIGTTFKSGRSPEFQGIVKADGSEHPFANCPLDSNFIKRFTSDLADFAAIAKPAFIITEDDFSLSAAMGCYCDLHIAEFNKRYGFSFTREELMKALAERTPEALNLIKKWRELAKDSQVEFATAMREALDKRNPEIPMGYLQAGLSDQDGECTYEIAKAMAGPNHVPFSRLYGAAYGGIVPHEIPQLLFHILYSKQHITGEFRYYMEADTFPHTRFFTAGCEMLSAISVIFSYGFDGALFIVRQLLDGANEETAYGKAYAKERKRLEALHRTVADCKLKGVQTQYDPFYCTLWDDRKSIPWSWWATLFGRFGIPYTTLESDVVCWDDRIAQYASDEEIRRVLSKVLIIDSAAAKILCDRGYGEYIGVSIGEDIKQGMLQWDLATREVITDDYVGLLPGRNMTAPWMLAPRGNGTLPRITVTDPTCRVITELYNSSHELITPAMTKFQNALGGTVIMQGLTVERNGSQALINYRRKHLLQTVIAECSDAYCMVKDAPDVMIIENKAQTVCGFKEVLTLLNMCGDPLDEVVLRLASDLREPREIFSLDIDGEWKPVSYRVTEDGVVVEQALHYCQPMYLMIR